MLDSSCTSYCKPLYMVTPLLTVLSHRERMHTEHLERINSRRCDSRLVVPWRSQMCRPVLKTRLLLHQSSQLGLLHAWVLCNVRTWIYCVCVCIATEHSLSATPNSVLQNFCKQLYVAFTSGYQVCLSLCERPEIQKWSTHIAACTSFVALC